MRRRRRRLGIALGILAALALIAVLVVRFSRDLPRRKLESALAARLSADVSVGGLSIDGLSRFVVTDLSIRRMAGQARLDSLRIATLEVTGSLLEIQQARFTTLRAVGAVVRLVPPDPSIPPAEGPGLSPTVERLTLERARILLGSGPEAAPGEDPEIVVSGTLDRVGSDLEGALTLTAETIPLASILALARAPEAAAAGSQPAGAADARFVGSGRLEKLEGRVTIAEGGKKIDTEARAARLVIPGADGSSGTVGTVELPSPSVEAHVRQDRDGGPYRIEVHPAISFAESLSASAVLDAKSFEILTLEASARGVDVAPVLALAGVLPRAWKAGGRADLTVEGSTPLFNGALEVRLTSVEGPLNSGAIAAKDLTAKVNGSFAVGSENAMSVDGSLVIGALSGKVQGRAVPEGVAPVEAWLSGSLAWGDAAGVVKAQAASTTTAAKTGAAAATTAATTSATATPDGTAPISFEGQATLTSPPLGRLMLEGRASAGPDTDVKWHWSEIDLERLAALAGALGIGLPEGLTATGQGRAEGTLAGTLAAPRVAGVLDLTALQVDSRAREPGASAATSAAKGASAAKGTRAVTASLADGRASVRFTWTGPAGAIDLPALQAQGRVRAGGLDPFDARLDATGRVDPYRGTMDVSRATVEAKGLARLQMSGFARRESPKAAPPATHTAPAPSAPTPSTPAPSTASAPVPPAFNALRAGATVHFDQVDLSRLQTALRPLTGDLAPGYAVKGDADGDASVALAPGGLVSGTGKTSIRGTSFSSSDGSQVLEGLDTTWDLSFGARLDDPGAPATLHANADVSGFQLLWGTIFVDGAKLASKLDVRAELTRGASGPARVDGRVEWTFPEGPRFAGTAAFAAGAPLDWTLEAESRDLATTFQRYVRTPLGDSIALFRKIEAAGTAHIEARGRWSEDAPTVSGRVRLGDMRIAGTEKVVEVTGLDLDLPFDLAWGPPDARGARPLSGAEREGSVRFAHLAVMGLDVPASSTGLRVRADTVEIEEGLAVPLLDGVVGFERLKLLDLLRPARRLESAMLVSSVSLARASRAFALPPLEGTADVYFPRVALSMDALAVDGGGEVRVFGGTLKLGAISGEDILSRYPKLVFSADFSDIDLAKLTHTFDFGEMTGIVRGYVHGCELFRGVPTAFDARVETDERPGVSRTVNVKAIQNLTILGTGTRPSIFDRGIHRFFDEYTYSRIGIAMYLKDDVFTLRGLEHRGDQELFVKGRLPFPINVVNAQPGFPISFQDMLERVKNLDVTAATVQK